MCDDAVLEDIRMSGKDDDNFEDILGPNPEPENLVDAEPPQSWPMGEASRALLERSRSYPMPKAPNEISIRGNATKNSPLRLQRILRFATEMPVNSAICKRAGISLTTLKYWLQKSKEGKPGDGFDIALGVNDENETLDNTVRFHEAYDLAFQAGVEAVDAVVHEYATGYLEPQVYRGRVQYRLDPNTVSDYTSRGLPIDDRDERLWLRDDFGSPIPETVKKIDPDLAMAILKAKHPAYRPKPVDVNVRGGVLVVGVRAATSEALNAIEEANIRANRPPVVFVEDDEG
jgi:hypothetical protein